MTGNRNGLGRRRSDRHIFERAILLVLVVLYLIGFVNAGNQADSIRDLTKKNAATLKDSQEGRARSIGASCRLNNRQNAALRRILIQSTKASKPFDNLYRQFGLPPYRERLKQTRAFARTLPPVSCAKLKSKAGL